MRYLFLKVGRVCLGFVLVVVFESNIAQMFLIKTFHGMKKETFWVSFYGLR